MLTNLTQTIRSIFLESILMKHLFLVGLLCSLSLASCSTSTEADPDTAQILQYDELNNSAGYAWFPAELNAFSPSSEMVASIRQNFRASEHHFVFFVKATCNCRGTTKLFPQIMKTLTQAGVPLSNIELYSMRASTDKHPYQAAISVQSLPTIVTLHSAAVSDLIFDQMYTGFNADTLIALALQK